MRSFDYICSFLANLYICQLQIYTLHPWILSPIFEVVVEVLVQMLVLAEVRYL